MNEDSRENLRFIAIVPNETDFEKGNFIDVRSPNPEDIAQLIVKELAKSNSITVASFGPRTITSHSYLVGQVSVLDSLLHSFIDAKIEVKIILKNSSKRKPHGSSYYSIKSNNHIDILAKKIQAFPENDFIKVFLSIQKFTIILLSLPSFIPFNNKSTTKYLINGWNVLMDPQDLIHTRAFALIHFDSNLQLESKVLKFLPNEERQIILSDKDSEKFENRVTITDEESRDDYQNEYSDDDQESSKIQRSYDDVQQKDGNEDKYSVASSRRSRVSRQSAFSQRSRNANLNGEDANNYNEYEEDMNEQKSTKSKSESKRKQKKIVRKKKPKQTINVQQLLDSENKNSKIEDSESSIPTESNLNYEEEEEGINSIEVQIHKFVSQLQLNIPVLTDTSVFSTLFQQLFYERWKSGILNSCRNDLSSLRDQIKERTTDEITGLKQLVSSRDMTLLIEREEKIMEALEEKTVNTIKEVLEKRLQAFSEIPQKSLLKNLQTACGDYVTCNKQLRDKRAELRNKIIELRILQYSRMEKLKDYHQKVEQLELAATGQARLDKAMVELNKLDQEKRKLEDDRDALLKQKEKVYNMLENKKLKSITGSKKK